MLRKRQFGYRLLRRVHEEEEEEESSREPSGGEGVRNDFNAARSRPPEAGAANRHVSEPSRAVPGRAPVLLMPAGEREAHAGRVTMLILLHVF